MLAPHELAAHSPPPHDPTRAPQRYAAHVDAVANGARLRAEAALRHARRKPPRFMEVVNDAAEFHDLGKLDEENQGPLSESRRKRLRWDHMDAGIAYLLAAGNEPAAWVVRGHHAPGLPCYGSETALPRMLRGGRKRDPEEGEHTALIARVDACLPEYLAGHHAACGAHAVTAVAADGLHGLAMRLALSCVVDADHTDSASYDAGVPTPMPDADAVPRKWKERLARLEAAVARKGRDAEMRGAAERLQDRRDFFRACLDSPVRAPLAACEGPVGIGKTLAITAHLLRAAQGTDREPELRHLFVVAPYTNIITQTVKELRAALVLPGENPEEVVAEHHHRADFSSPGARSLATLWRAPVIVTTAVQFFETLASNEPARLRKLHELPGSAVFLDEAHAALPAPLWPQNWRWMRELAEGWGCRLIFASGSLARFWEIDRIVDPPVEVPELISSPRAGRVLAGRLNARETTRVRYESLGVLGVDALCDRVRKAGGPRLVILNTVQTAALIARRMRTAGDNVLHLSTALCPRDRDRILRTVRARLRLERAIASRCSKSEALVGRRDWTLVATSCVEAGVDLSFCTAFRERASAASLIQVGGRGNRHGERGQAVVYDFVFASDEPGVTQNPEWRRARTVVADLFDEERFNDQDAAGLVTDAIRRELEERVRFEERLTDREKNWDYPGAAQAGRVIDTESVFVVIDTDLRERLERPGRVPQRALLAGSVQMYVGMAAKYAGGGPAAWMGGCGLIAPIPNREGVYAWNAGYDPTFLGYMDGVFAAREGVETGTFVA